MPARATLVISLMLAAPVARAQANIFVDVTHAEDKFDLRAVDPSGVAYALNLTRSSSEIWASTDNARTWTFRGKHPLGSDFKTMTALSDGTLLADAQSASGFTLARSVDHGATWKDVLSLGQSRLLTPHSILEQGGLVYLIEYQVTSQASAPVRLWTSADDGATWTVLQTFMGHRHGHGIRADDTGALWVFFGDDPQQAGTYRSTDGGHTWTPVLLGEEGRIVDAVFQNGNLLAGQDIPNGPPQPSIIRLTPDGQLTKLRSLPGPSYSIHAVPGGGFLLGTTREIAGNVFAPGDVSAHLFGSADGTHWVELGSYPRIDDTDYARADVYWVLPSGEAVLNLRHVTTLGSGRGYQLLRVTIAVPEETIRFQDNFDGCTSTTNLGPRWSITGRWYCKADRARGEQPAGVAVAQTVVLEDTDVTALVQLNASSGSGLVARYANGSYYALRIFPGNRADLVRVNGTTVTVLASVTVPILDSTSYHLRLTATGSAPVRLEAFREGISIMTYTDVTGPLTVGLAGLLQGSGFRTQFDNFSILGSVAPALSTVFSDNFDACTSTTNLGAAWTIDGIWYCKVGRARGETINGLALVNQSLPPDQIVESLVQLNGQATGSGVVARAAAGHFYLARILLSGTFELDRVDNGVFTVLGSVPRSFSTDVSVIIRLQVTGDSSVNLAASVNGDTLIVATDSTADRLSGGSAGLFSSAPPGSALPRTQYDNFRVLTP